MIETPRSVYARGADDGLYMGAYLSALMVIFGLATHYALASVAALVMMAAVPLIIFRFLKRSLAEDCGRSTFSALWLHGICIFFFGGLLMAVTIYVCLRFVQPGFLTEQMNNVIAFYLSMDDPQATEFAGTLSKMVKYGQLPSPLEIALEMVWLGVFTGSMLSMVIAYIVRRKGLKTPPPFKNTPDNNI